LARYGTEVDPPTLNQYFITHGNYLHDPSEAVGLNDDLTWSSVAAYDGQIGIASTGTGWPSSNEAIVKFIYKSSRTHTTVTHFCLVADASAHTIIDSWDGITKVSPYGTPVSWASYDKHEVQPVTPPAPVEAPAFTVENIPERTEELKVDTHIWDLNQRSWPAMVNNPVGTGNKGTTFTTTAIAHHIVGGAYYLPQGSTTQGYNLVDCEDQPAAPAVVEAVASVTVPHGPYTNNTVDGIEFSSYTPDMNKRYIIKPEGAEKWNFKGVKEWGDFKSVQHFNYGDAVFISGSALHIALNARYEVNSNDWNGFEANGQPNGWYGFNKTDISATKPADLTPPAPVVVPAPAPVAATAPVAPIVATPPATITTEPAATTAPIDWQTTYRPLPAPTKYCAVKPLIVRDLSGQMKDEKLPAYDFKTIFKSKPEPGVVRVFGTVTYEGVDYYRLRTNNDPDFKYWYCVPIIDPRTKKVLLVNHPDNPVDTGITLTREVLNVSSSGINKLLRVILPSWFNKK
jgi:hypothetical protein